LLENLELGKAEFRSAGKFLLESRKKFREGDKESVKVAKLRKIEQRRRTIEEFV